MREGAGRDLFRRGISLADNLRHQINIWQTAETERTNVRVNLFNPGATRTRMRATAMPGEDPMTLPTPEEVAETVVPLCLAEFTETGRLYDYRSRKLLSYQMPA